MAYVAPLKDMLFNIRHLARIDEIARLPGFEDAGLETAQAVLEESARFNQDVVAPLNEAGDRNPSSWSDGVVTTTPGFKDAFKQFAAGGWQGLQHPSDFGGQGLPKTIGAACGEMLNSANLSFALCPLLTDGAIEALLTAGSDDLKATYLEKLVSGEWTGTMNLTEPQAGSDLAQVATRAVRQPDGSYRVTGQKIYITYGEHDLAENISHLVLARTPDGPPGVKGISLFIVPKFLVGDDGAVGARNDVWCASIEHKLGIHGSPTAVLMFGSGQGDVGEGAVGYVVGEENRGLEYMFIMMNAARYAVGQQGIAVSERAYQQALAYARDRVQSRAVEGSSGPVPIARHPDVQRMLLTMRALTEAGRAVSFVAAAAHDRGKHHADAQVRARNMAFYEYLVPVIKGFSTEAALEVTSLGVQVHGGMGFIEETGAAQHYRDARILPIYEGTTAIQANDLVGRKTLRDGGAVAAAAIAAMRDTLAALATVVAGARSDGAPQGAWAVLHDHFEAAIGAYENAVQYVLAHAKGNPRAVFAGSVPYLMLTGLTHGGWQMARAALACEQHIRDGDTDKFYVQKRATAFFYGAQLLPRVTALSQAVLAGEVTEACGSDGDIA